MNGPYSSDGIPITAGQKVSLRVVQTSGSAQTFSKVQLGVAQLEPKGSGGLLLPALPVSPWVPPENPIYYVGNQSNLVQKRQGVSTVDWTFNDPTDRVVSLAVSPEQVLVAGDQNNDIWRIDPDGNQIWKFTGHTGFVNALAVSSDGFIYSASSDGLVKKIDLDGTEVWSTDTGRAGTKLSLSLSGADVLYVGGAIDVGSDATGLARLDTADGSLDWRLVDLDGTTGQCFGMAADPDGFVNVGLSVNMGVRVDSAGNVVWKFDTPTDDVYGVACSPDAVFFSSFDQKVYKVALDGVEVWQHALGAFSYVVEVDPDGFVYASRNAEIRQLNPDGTEAFTTLSTGSTVRSLAVLPGRYGAFG